MGIYQIALIVVTLAYCVTSKGYGPATGVAPGSIGQVRGGTGGYTPGASGIGVGGRTSLGGMGSNARGAGGPATVGGTRGSMPLGGAGGYSRIAGGSPAGGFGGSMPFSGSYVGGIGQPGAGQTGTFGSSAGYAIQFKPYSYSYEEPDGQGGVQFKSESADASGNVQGNYGYKDSQGLYRQVEYTADQSGFRATINTNEPGVGKDSPADVNMIVEQTPAGIQEQYTPAAVYQTGVTGRLGVQGINVGGNVIGAPGSFVSGGYQGVYQGGSQSGYQGGSQSGYQGASQSGYQGASQSGYGGGQQRPGSLGTGSSGLFAGIKKTSSGKSTY